MASEINTQSSFKQYVLRKLKLGFQEKLPNSQIETEVYFDNYLNDFIMRVTASVLSNEVKNEHSEIKIPETWWDHVKERFFSRWLMVHYRTVTIQTTYRACPHLKIPDDKQHVDFLVYGVTSNGNRSQT